MDEMQKKECLEYFRSHPVFRRLLEGFREKYASYGRFAGTVVLKNLTEEERDDLEGFLNRNYHGKKSASVSPGNPTMTSVVIATLGILSFIFLNNSIYSSLV